MLSSRGTWVGRLTKKPRIYQGGQRRVMRRTVVFELEKDTWKVVHSHFSAGVPNLELMGADLTRTLSEVLESVAEGRHA